MASPQDATSQPMQKQHVGARRDSQYRPSRLLKAWELFKSSAPSNRFSVSSLRYHPSLDLTIVESTAPHPISLQTATTAPTTGDPIVVVGYPQWNSLGDRLAAAPCRIIQLKTINGVRLLLTNASLREGNSGGPPLFINVDLHTFAV